MSEKEYMDADYEVIGMCNRKAGSGGQLPGKTLTFIPTERAERVEALDRRIQQIQQVLPFASAAALLLAGLALGQLM